MFLAGVIPKNQYVMIMDLDIAKNVGMYIAIFVVLFFLAMQMQGLSLEPHVSDSYATFYYNAAMLGIGGVLGVIVFNLKYWGILNIPVKFKIAIHIVWIIFIISITVFAGQILPVAKSFEGEPLQLNKETELYSASFPPGILEDWTYLWCLPLILLVAMLLYMEATEGIIGASVGIALGVAIALVLSLGLGGILILAFILGAVGYFLGEMPIGAGTILALAVVACLISATGYNIWVIPGFTSAHVPAYGNAQNAYVGAWTFAVGQSLVYVFTGWFIPAAHIIHNYLIAYGHLYQINAGGFNIVGG